MKRSIEAGDLRNLRRALHHCTDRGEVVRLMQRRERDKTIERRKQRLIHSHRLRVLHSAMDDAVPDADELRTTRTLAQECEQMPQRSLVAELGTCGPVSRADFDALGVPRDEMRLAEQRLDLSAQAQFERALLPE